MLATSEQLGALIRGRRKDLGITQKELAMACGTGLRFLIELEKGKPTCQIGKTLDVLRALGLAIEARPLDGGRADGELR